MHIPLFAFIILNLSFHLRHHIKVLRNYSLFPTLVLYTSNITPLTRKPWFSMWSKNPSGNNSTVMPARQAGNPCSYISATQQNIYWHNTHYFERMYVASSWTPKKTQPKYCKAHSHTHTTDMMLKMVKINVLYHNFSYIFTAFVLAMLFHADRQYNRTTKGVEITRNS